MSPVPMAGGTSRLLLSFYGDDFTGSTDVMEVLEWAGIPTLLFLRPPTAADLSAQPAIRAVGLAGISRTMSHADMDAELPQLFEAMASLDAMTFHYKLCSTFDSSTSVGSIGRALELVRARFGSGAPIPLVVGSPPLGRYTVFGNLYARAGAAVYRLDRHPTLPRHPITPMREADLLRHLSRQTDLPLAAIDSIALDGPLDALEHRYGRLAEDGAAVILFDVLTNAHLATIGQLIWSSLAQASPLLAGSSGIESALVEHWRQRRWLAEAPPAPAVDERATVLTLSGSCSEATNAQLAHAEAAGHQMIRLPGQAAGDPATAAQISAAAATALARHRSVAVFTARGPRDCDDSAPAAALGDALADVAAAILARERPGRVVVAGGDTSGRVARRLAIDALRVIAPIAPGSPLCRAQSSDPQIDGLEIALKGGQVGQAAYLEQVRLGSVPPRVPVPVGPSG